MRILISVLLIAVLAMHSAYAVQDTKPPLSYDFQLGDDGEIQGPARKWLAERGKPARFVMIGEIHGLADVPVFSKSLYKLTDRTAVAIETDVWAAKKLEDLSYDKDDSFDRYFERRSNQYAIPFYSWKEEAEFLNSVTEIAGGVRPSIWGLDQIFAFGGKIITERLRGKIRKSETKAALDAFENSLVTRPVIIGYGRQEAIEPLYQALLKEDDIEVQEIAEALKASNEIYAPFTRGAGSGLIANQRRERMMKEIFFTYFSNARKYAGLQKPMLKFGKFHMYRGITPTGVVGLGGFVDALATARGEPTLAVSIVCGEGSAARQFDGSVETCSNNDIEKSRPLIAKLAAESSGNLLIDTVALRVHGGELMKLTSDSERDELASFDAIVIIKNSKPATQFEAKIEDMDLGAILQAESER
ncbi:hypothetical protein [Kordiimonas sp. SCSIO 12610]|uniref:hypothetical protein n=1 Tax=Kordiimonas sp. SCSIO 12610 TaxID=2829597 RepID=UPI00210A1B9A|nr:hypothetical protein [Kordiimonas sp. SCSIO 12610]UTW54928.1 hypothetical protein KFF44_14140 [Kordiimonas sp. SCSIO 12610]